MRTLLQRWHGDRRGVAAVEFAFLAPIFALILTATVDVGALVYTNMRLNTSLTAGSSYALVNGAQWSSDTVGDLAQRLTGVLAGGRPGVETRITVNDAASYVYSSGRLRASGSTSVADQCFCPEIVGAAVDWGAARTCGRACPSGAVAGKFVELSISRPYTPLFGGFGMTDGGSYLAATTMLQVD